jgi:hypothetical protein
MCSLAKTETIQCGVFVFCCQTETIGVVFWPVAVKRVLGVVLEHMYFKTTPGF